MASFAHLSRLKQGGLLLGGLVFFALLGRSVAQPEVHLSGALLAGIALLVAMSAVVLMEDQPLVAIVTLAFALRFTMGWLQSSFFIFPYGWDESGYHSLALILLDVWKYGHPLQLPSWAAGTTSYYPYSALTAACYLLLGDTDLTMRMINSFLGSLVAYYVYRITFLVFEHKLTALRAALMTALMPTYIFFTCLHMRDAVAWFLSVVMLYHFMVWLKEKQWGHLLVSALALAAATPFRDANLPLYLAVLAPFVWYYFYRSWARGFLGWLVIVVLLPLGIVVVGFSLLTEDLIPGLSKLNLDYFRIEMQWRTMSGNAGYMADTVYNSWGDIIFALPLRFIHFMFGPFLWKIENGSQLLTAIEGTLFFLLFLISVRYLWKNRRRLLNRELVACLLWFSTLGILANAAIDSNYGTAARHRINYSFVYLIFSAAAFYLPKKNSPASAG